jgi:HSP20 family protein
VFHGPASSVLAFELAGVGPEDVSVTIEGGELVVRGVRRPPAVDAALRPIVIEQAWGRFERRLALPRHCDPKRAAARYERGMLEVTLPATDGTPTVEFQVPIR